MNKVLSTPPKKAEKKHPSGFPSASGRARQKLMIVSWGVFPGTGGSVIILNNLARVFSKEELVIVGQRQDRETIDVWPDTYPNIYYLDPLRLKTGRGVKYTRWLSVRKLVADLVRIYRSEKCTAIFSIFPDELFMYAAYRASKIVDAPFHTWFHNTYLDNRTGLLKLLAAYLQPKFFDHAGVNFVMSEGMRDFYREQYPSIPFTTLTHGFQIPKTTFEPYDLPKGKVKFLFSGTLNASCLDASLRLFDVILSNDQYELHIFTGKNTLFDRHGIQGKNVINHGFLPLDLFIEKMKACDILLLPHGFDGFRTAAEYKTIFPTRTIPLLYANRPILCHSPPDTFLTTFFQKHDCGLVVSEKSTSAIREAIHTLCTNEALGYHIVKNAMKTAAQFDLNTVANRLRNAIYGVTSD